MNLSFLPPWFASPKPVAVTVRTFKTKKTDLERLREAKHKQLARELGREFRIARP